MTAKELIEVLKKFPEDMVVKSWYDYDYHSVYKLEKHIRQDDEKPFIALRF